MKPPTKHQRTRSTRAVARYLGRLVRDDEQPVPISRDAYVEGNGIMLVDHWDGEHPAIVGEGSGLPMEWTFWTSEDLTLRQELADLGVWVEPNDLCTLCLYRLDAE